MLIIKHGKHVVNDETAQQSIKIHNMFVPNVVANLK